MGLAQIAHQPLIRIGDQPRWLDVRGRHVEVGQAASGQRQKVHPHRVIARFERAAHDSRQHNDDRLRCNRSLPVVLGCDLGWLLFQRMEDVHIRTHERGHNPARGIGIAEVMKMIDAATSVDPVVNDSGPLGAAEHRRGIDDEVVVFPVVKIGDQRLERAPRGVARKIAAHHMQVGAGRLTGAIEHANER